MCLKPDKEYVINLLEREIIKAKNMDNRLHNYKDRIDLFEKIIKFLENEN